MFNLIFKTLGVNNVINKVIDEAIEATDLNDLAKNFLQGRSADNEDEIIELLIEFIIEVLEVLRGRL